MNTPLTPATHRVSYAIGDEQTAKRAADALEDIFFEDQAAIAAFERPDGSWGVTLHFADVPDQALLRRVVADAAGEAAAGPIVGDTIEAKDWVRASLDDLVPVPAGPLFVDRPGHHGRRAPEQRG